MSIQSVEQKLDKLIHAVSKLSESISVIESGIKYLRSTAESRTQLSQLELRSSIPKRFGKILAVFATVIGAVASYTALRYDVSIANFTSLNTNLPFESRFIVKNEAPFSIYNVYYFCGSVNVRMGGGRELVNATEVPIPLPQLRAHSSYSVRCQHPFGNLHIDTGAFLEIHILYTPKFLPWWTREGGQQFVLKYDQNGQSVWIPTGFFTKTSEEMRNEMVNP